MHRFIINNKKIKRKIFKKLSIYVIILQMYLFEEHCVKFDDHNTAINNYVLDEWPTVRIKQENEYILGITLHKWNLEPSGNYIAIYKISDPIDESDEIWTEPSQSKYFQELQLSLRTAHECIKKSNVLNIIKNIENGTFDNIIIYKYHANQWRPIEKKKTKWAYIGKQVKTDICNIQRLLH